MTESRERKKKKQRKQEKHDTSLTRCSDFKVSIILQEKHFIIANESGRRKKREEKERKKKLRDFFKFYICNFYTRRI